MFCAFKIIWMNLGTWLDTERLTYFCLFIDCLFVCCSLLLYTYAHLRTAAGNEGEAAAEIHCW